MRVVTKLFLVAGLLLVTSGAQAQLSLVVQMDPTPSPYISDWRSNPNTIRFIVTNPTGSPVQVRFDGYIEGDRRGKVARTKPDAAIPPVTIEPGTSTFNGIDAGLLHENAVEYIGSSRNETQRSGRLPEDNFRLCVHLIAYNAPHASLSPEACARFEIKLIQPPALVAPANNSSPQAPPAFSWTAVALGIGTFARYQLTVVELDPGQTNIPNAIQTNLPLFVRETTLPVYQTLNSDPQFEKGKRYAWRVKAYDQQDRYTFGSDGYSEIWSFTYTPVLPPMRDTTTMAVKYSGKKTVITPNIQTGITNKIKVAIFTNARITGQIFYTFNRSNLYRENVVGASFLEQQNLGHIMPGGGGSDLKPLTNVVLRLRRRYKTKPMLAYMSGTVWDFTNQKSYNTAEQTIGETTSDAAGNFTFSFIDTEPTTVVANATLRSGGGEFADVKENASLFKFYVVEVVNPHYCSSGSEIAVEPGATTNVSLSSLVRTYNLSVTIKDSEQEVELGSRVNVYLARITKNLRPFTAPEDEGELEPSSLLFNKFNPNAPTPDDPEHSFYSKSYGYVICASHTKDSPNKGVVTFKRLVRNVGGWDGYTLSAFTPEKTPSGNTNALYYYDNNFACWASHTKLNDDQGYFDTGYDYSGEVVYNKSYKIPTFYHTIHLKPKLSRILGQVKRSDSDSSLVNVVVRLTTNPANPPDLSPGQYDGWFYGISDNDGRFEVNNIQPSGANWSYDVKFLKYGYDPLPLYGMAIPKGRQIDVGVKYLTPKLVISRQVVDEDAQPLPGVEGVLGDGAAIKTDAKGVFVSRAVPGWQPFHLEKRTKYADKDTNVIIQDNAFEVLGALLVDKIVMFEARRRLAIRVINLQGLPIKDAEVILTDYYNGPSGSGSSSSSKYKVVKLLASPYRKTTGDDGWVQFSFLSPTDVAHVSITVPNSDYIATNRTFSGLKETGEWAKRTVLLLAGGRVAGTVYAGPKRETKAKTPDKLQNKSIQQGLQQGGQQQSGGGGVKSVQQPSQVVTAALHVKFPVKGARVFIEGREDMPVFTDENGHYELRAVPPGKRIVKGARAADSVGMQLVGDEQPVTVVSLQTTEADLYLTKYNGMDITRLLGFPVEIDKLTELAAGRIRISGALVDIPNNSVFKVRNDEDRYAFVNVELMPSGTGTPPASQPSVGVLPLLDARIPLTAYDTYNTELVQPGGVVVVPAGSDFTKGRFRAPVTLPMAGWSINSNELTLEDADGNPVDFYVRRVSSGGAPDVQVAALTSEGGAFDDGGKSLRVCGATGADAPFKLYAYNTFTTADSSWLAPDGMHLHPVIRVSLEGCGASYGNTCNVDFSIGDLRVRKSGMDPLDPSGIAERTITLQKWQLTAHDFSIQSGYITFNGDIHAPVVANKIDPASTVIVPFTAMQLRPDKLMGGSFPQSSVDILGISKVELTDKLTLASDQESWFLSTLNPEIRINQGGGKVLEGFDPSEKLLLSSLLLRSNATHKFSPSEKSYIVYSVSSFKLSTLQVDWDVDHAMLSMQGSLTLINVPDLAPQYTRLYFTAGGKFGMDGVFLNDGYIAGGVRLYIANGQLGPNGFTAEGDWGQYHNRIQLQGKFALNMSFRHRKVGGGYSTIAEVINPGHNPPQNQSMFGNSSQPDVKSVYGRTQLEPGLVWSTNLVGWYATSELAGKDSMYFAVQGSGGNGTVVTANGTLKMKGTRGGLSSLVINRPDEYPKGPSPMPPPSDDGPFSNMTITTDFENMSIIATIQLDYEITPGTSFKGFLETVLSFGPKKFWSFFAAGDGKIDNPPCEGKALFIAGANYEIPPDRQQMVIEYSISKRPLPDEFKTITGFFTQVAVVMPIPGLPNFSIDVVMFKLSVECTMGGEARLGLNFANGTTFYIGIYATAKVEVYAGATIWFPPIPVALSVKGHAIVAAGAGGYFTYNSNAGSSFDITGFILGQLDVEGCVTVITEDFCTGTVTVFKVRGDINGRLGNNEYLDIKPTFEFLGL